MTENSNGVIILITLLNILVYKLQQLQEAKFTEHTNQLSLNLQRLCRRFSLRDIKWATFNFNDELVIGQGGFGMVYRGIIDFGARIVAIKRLKSTSKQGSKEFLTEIEMLSKFQHSHVVSLVGYCDDCHEMILVYEYMPCGTLADHLHKRVRNGDTSSPPLSWEQRLKICIGAARGLEYLHTGTSVEHRVIHRDVKSSNILLDENMAAKISDFGLSKIGPSNQAFSTYVSTRVKGTPGYMDPYYFETLRLTRKSDVYGFGVVLFEVLCGRPAVDNSLDDEQRGLAGWAQHCFKEGLLDQIIDPTIKGKIFPNSLVAFVRVAIQCLHNGPKHRPTMAEVVVGLESALALQESSKIYILPEVPLTNCSSQGNVNANSSTSEGQNMKCNQEQVDSSMVGENQGNLLSPIVEVENANHNQENKNSSLEKGVINDADGGHHVVRSTARMTFTEKLSLFLSGRARMFSGKTLPKPMFSGIYNPPKNVHGEQVAAGWDKGGESYLAVSRRREKVAVENAGGKEGGGDHDQNGGDQKEQKDGSVQRRGERRRRPNPRLSNPPKNVHGEQVAAGWPSWLSAVAGEAINGWTPRPAHSFEKIDKIGQGTYSNVYKARDTITTKIVALKKVRFDSLDPESVKFMAREILILRRLDHPNVIKLEGLVTSRMSGSLYLIFEYMEHDLAGLASSPKIKFTEPQLLSGLEHCHKRNVLHRDIKGSNLLLDNRGVLKIADFGSASLFDPKHKQLMTSRVVTLWYRPPELLLGATDYGVGVDLWSAGCILAELLAGKPIMPGRTEMEQLHKIFKLCGSPSDEYWKKSKLPHETIFKRQQSYKRCIAEIFKDFPPSSLPLIETLLAIDPAERQTATAALRSEFFTTIPFACDPSSLPKYPPSKEMDVLRDAQARRLRAAGRSNADGVKKARTHDRAAMAIIPDPEANAELQANLDVWSDKLFL